MASKEGRKYEVTLPDGRVVSKQRAWQIAHPDIEKERKLRWARSEAGKRSRSLTNKRQRDKRRIALLQANS